MFYDDYCITDEQKAIFKAIVKLSNGSKYIAIQELDYLGIPRNKIEDVLRYFEEKWLFKEVQHLGEDHPVIFRI